MNWVLQQPAAIVATATVAIMVGLAVSGLLLFRRLVPQSRLAKSMSVTGQAFTLVGVLYPLVAAFALTTAWDNYQSAQDATEHEAGAVNELLNASEALPAAVRPAVQQQTDRPPVRPAPGTAADPLRRTTGDQDRDFGVRAIHRVR